MTFFLIMHTIDPLPHGGVVIKSHGLTHPRHSNVGQEISALGSISIQMWMSSDYFSSLDYSTRTRYLEKLYIDGETLPDPYNITDDQWLDDVSKWPTVEFGDVYTYLIDSVGNFTKEKLKAYKSLEAYNYFYNGYVRTVFYYQRECSKFVILSAKVNPSQKAADKAHQAWVVLCQEDGSVKSAHCMCMAG